MTSLVKNVAPVNCPGGSPAPTSQSTSGLFKTGNNFVCKKSTAAHNFPVSIRDSLGINLKMENSVCKIMYCILTVKYIFRIMLDFDSVVFY